MIGINDLYKRFSAESNTQQGGHVRPQGNFVEWVKSIQMELYESLITDWQKSQVISDRLRPFFKSVNVTVQHLPGRGHDMFLYPAEYAHFSSARILVRGDDTTCGCKGNELIDGKTGKVCKQENGCTGFVDPDEVSQVVDDSLCERPIIGPIDNDRWGSVCSHRIKMPTLKKPYITQTEGGFKIAPQKIAIVVLDYFRLPAEPVYNYTIGAGDEIIFNPTGSVNLEWDVSLVNEFLSRLGKKYGKFIKDGEMYAASESERRIQV